MICMKQLRRMLRIRILTLQLVWMMLWGDCTKEKRSHDVCVIWEQERSLPW
ncbi:hypothetical protein LINPERHAP2_LOCUS9377 [Linum perenne]